MPDKNAPVLVQLQEIGDLPYYHLIVHLMNRPDGRVRTVAWTD